MDYLKVWTSFREAIAPLTDAEKGRLFDAMLVYAETGEEPDGFEGNERILWPITKQGIDRASTKSDACSENGSKGGRGNKKPTEANESEKKPTKANESHKDNNNDNDNDKVDEEKEKKEKKRVELAKHEERFNQFWSAYPRKEDKAKAAQYFLRINPDDELLQTMLASIEKWKQSDQWQEKQYIPHPSTWLNGKRWEDEVPAPAAKVTPIRAAPTKTVVAQQYEQRSYTGIDAQLMSEQDREMEEWMRNEGML